MPEYDTKPPPRPKDDRGKDRNRTGDDLPLQARRPFLHGLLRGFIAPLLAVVVVLGGVAVIAGTPHVGWDYECLGRSSSGGGCESYRYCAYYGVQGRRVVVPAAGERCGLIKMLRPDWGALWPAAAL